MARKTTKTTPTPKTPKPRKPRIPKSAAAAPELPTAPVPDQRTLDRTREQSHYALKRKVRMFYDLQKLRLQTAGRTAGKPRDDEDEEEAARVESAKQAMATPPPKGPERPKIELHPADVLVLDLRAQELGRAEKHALQDIADHLGSIGFYRDVLSDKKRYRGIGPTMAGVILAEYDIHRLETVSQMWAFAGLRPMPCDRCTKCQSVLREDGQHVSPKTLCKGQPPPGTYASGRAQKPTRGEKLPYNAFLRAKLCGVLAAVLLKLNPSVPADGCAPSPWRKFYDDYKLRKQSAGWGVSDAHRHVASMRYMIKMLLADIWEKWRTYEGLPVRPSYQEQYLGHTHHGAGARPANVDTAMTPEIEAELEAAAQ